MTTEINEGRGCGPDKDHVLLDITHLARHHHEAPAGHPRDRDPVRRRRSDQGSDPGRADLPLPDGRHSDQLQGPGRGAADGNPNSPVPGFYAAGECACASVHGANRLGTNSLLDLLVFGKSAGETVVEDFQSASSLKPLPADAADVSLARLARLDGQTNGESVHESASRCAHHAEALPACSASTTC
jgi:succinate dehydrogenase / fumarate reductase flavoprotein subunit